MDPTTVDALPVFFSRKEFDREKVERPSVVLSPSTVNWNDFRYRSRFVARVFAPHGEDGDYKSELYLGFLEDEQKHEQSLEKIEQESWLSANSLPEFFTLLPSMKAYREFVESFGPAAATELLLLINDLVALGSRAENQKLLNEAKKSKIFRLSFQRESESFFAFHNAAPILRGLESERLDRISKNLKLEFQLAGFEGPHHIRLTFDQSGLLPRRIALFIGRNGLGKSQALNTIVRSLINDDERLRDADSGRPQISRVLAIATPGETTNTFPANRNYARINYQRLNLTRGGRASPSHRFGEVCVRLARSEETIKGRSRWEVLMNTLERRTGGDQVVLQLSDDENVGSSRAIRLGDKRYFPLNELRKGREQELLEVWGAASNNFDPKRLIGDRVYPLSSGQLSFLKFAVQACLFIENGTVVLLDEPETHLHPNYVSEFVSLLDRLLELTGSVAVLATHSAYLVRELPSSQVHVFKRMDENGVSVVNPRLRTLGADIGSISFFVFEDEIASKLVSSLIPQFPDSTASRRNLIKEISPEMSPKALMMLKRELGIQESDEED